MSKSFFYFKGTFCGVFTKKIKNFGHGYQFYDFNWEFIEIFDVTELITGSYEKEKYGDYIYLNAVKPKKYFFWKGVDIVLNLPDGKSYSKEIYNLVIKDYAGERQNKKHYIRNLGKIQLGHEKGIIYGVIFFSLPKPTVSTPVSTFFAKKINNSLISKVENIKGNLFAYFHQFNKSTISNDVNYYKPIDNNSKEKVNKPNIFFYKLFGTLKQFFKVFLKVLRFLFIIGLLILLFQYLGSCLKTKWKQNPIKTKEGNVQLKEQRLDPRQDTFAPQPWNYLVDHKVNWSDFKSREFISTYTTGTLAYEDSKKQHIHWINSPNPGELTYWHDLYYDFNKHDQNKIVDLVNYFINEKQSKGLNIIETAELITTFIQEIPYYLIHEESCEKVTQLGGFISQYHAEKRPCLPYIIGGIQTPYEFLHNLKGDCDTRSLLGYTILKRMGINSSVWVSSEYGHSILGVAVPVNSPHYKNINGIRHFGVELTAKGYRIGMIAPEHSNMYNWSIALN